MGLAAFLGVLGFLGILAFFSLAALFGLAAAYCSAAETLKDPEAPFPLVWTSLFDEGGKLVDGCDVLLDGNQNNVELQVK